MKKGPECNEVLAFKFHYLGYILSEIHRCSYVFLSADSCSLLFVVHILNVQICFRRTSQNQTDPFETFVKKILKGSRGEEYLELLLRDCVREFPYREGFLFQQVLKFYCLDDFSCFANFFFKYFSFLANTMQSEKNYSVSKFVNNWENLISSQIYEKWVLKEISYYIWEPLPEILPFDWF